MIDSRGYIFFRASTCRSQERLFNYQAASKSRWRKAAKYEGVELLEPDMAAGSEPGSPSRQSSTTTREKHVPNSRVGKSRPLNSYWEHYPGQGPSFYGDASLGCQKKCCLQNPYMCKPFHYDVPWLLTTANLLCLNIGKNLSVAKLPLQKSLQAACYLQIDYFCNG